MFRLLEKGLSMKAMVITQFGSSEVFEEREQLSLIFINFSVSDREVDENQA
jgi:hypothetical protein